MNSATVAGFFLIQTLFDLYLSVLILRLILQFFNADFYNPISQFVVKLTDPLILPLRRVIPRVRFIDLSVLTLFIIIDIIKFVLLIVLFGSSSLRIFSFILLVIFDFIKLTLNIFFYAILIRVILSWISPYSAEPAMEVLYKITEPLLAPIRRVIPPIAGFDLSPLFVLIGLKLISIFLTGS